MKYAAATMGQSRRHSSSINTVSLWRIVRALVGVIAAAAPHSLAIAQNDAAAPQLAVAPQLAAAPSNVAKLVNQLSSEVFAEREDAARQLNTMTEPAAAKEILAAIIASWRTQPNRCRDQIDVWDVAWNNWLGDYRDLASQPETQNATDKKAASMEIALEDAWMVEVVEKVCSSKSGLNTDEMPENADSEFLPLAKPAAPHPQQELTLSALERIYRLATAQTTTLPKVRSALQNKLAKQTQPQSPHAELLLHHLQPVISAEIWTRDHNEWRHITAQYLIVGIPQMPELGRTTTFFDSANGETAHLKNGNQLIPGDYVLNTAFPYNKMPTETINPNISIAGASYPRAFYLAYLPTPKSRYAYDNYLASTTKEQRWAYISRRTIMKWKQQDKVLADADAWLLSRLDINEARSFIFERIAKAGDESLAGPNWQYAGTRVDTALIRLLAERTDVATADQLKQWMQENAQSAHAEAVMEARKSWLAILAKSKDVEADDRLADAIQSPDPISQTATAEGQSSTATLGASAAATLLAKHGVAPESMGLATLEIVSSASPYVADPFMDPDYRLITYPSQVSPRIAAWLASGQPERVNAWWARRRAFISNHKIP